MTSITIPDSVEYIGNLAFYDCRGLCSVSFGEGLKSIGAFAFENCDGLTDVYYTGSEQLFQKIEIDNTNQAIESAQKHYHHVW